jgi:hypothetical protein
VEEWVLVGRENSLFRRPGPRQNFVRGALRNRARAFRQRQERSSDSPEEESDVF